MAAQTFETETAPGTRYTVELDADGNVNIHVDPEAHWIMLEEWREILRFAEYHTGPDAP